MKLHPSASKKAAGKPAETIGYGLVGVGFQVIASTPPIRLRTRPIAKPPIALPNKLSTENSTISAPQVVCSCCST